MVALFLVPFFSNRGERAPSRRPMAVLLVVVIYTTLGVLTYEGATAPWSPQMTAWSGDPVPEKMVRDSSPLELQGALVFQNKNCRNCHALDGRGDAEDEEVEELGDAADDHADRDLAGRDLARLVAGGPGVLFQPA